MKKDVVMKFKTEKNKTVAIRLTQVKEDVDAEGVKGFMDILLKKNILLTKTGQLKAKESAMFVSTKVTPVEID